MAPEAPTQKTTEKALHGLGNTFGFNKSFWDDPENSQKYIITISYT